MITQSDLPYRDEEAVAELPPEPVCDRAAEEDANKVADEEDGLRVAGDQPPIAHEVPAFDSGVLLWSKFFVVFSIISKIVLLEKATRRIPSVCTAWWACPPAASGGLGSRRRGERGRTAQCQTLGSGRIRRQGACEKKIGQQHSLHWHVIVVFIGTYLGAVAFNHVSTCAEGKKLF